MKRRPQREFNVFSLSAMDLFASALGAFVVIAVMLFPFYQKNAPTLAQAAQVQKEAAELQRQTDSLKAQAAQDRKRATAARSAAEAAEERRAAVEAETEALNVQLREGGETLEQCRIALSKLDIHEYDLVLVFDTSGSMAGVIEGIIRNLGGMVRVLHKMVPDLRIGLVAFHDGISEDFQLRQMDEAGVAAAVAWLEAHGSGGGTGATDVARGLEAAAAMAWRTEVPHSIVVVADDPDDDPAPQRAHEIARSFAAHPKAKVAVVSPEHAGEPDFFKQLAQAGGGEFVVDRGDLLTSVLLSVIER